MQESVSDFFPILEFLVPMFRGTRPLFEALTQADVTTLQASALLQLVAVLMLRREHQHVTHEMRLPARHQVTRQLSLDGFERDVYLRVAEACSKQFCDVSCRRNLWNARDATAA
jgi:hypothetical protein